MGMGYDIRGDDGDVDELCTCNTQNSMRLANTFSSFLHFARHFHVACRGFSPVLAIIVIVVSDIAMHRSVRDSFASFVWIVLIALLQMSSKAFRP